MHATTRPATRSVDVGTSFWHVDLAGTYDATVSTTVNLPDGVNITCVYGKYMVGLAQPIPLRQGRRLLRTFNQAIAYAYQDHHPLREPELRTPHMGPMRGIAVPRGAITYGIIPDLEDGTRNVASFMLMRVPGARRKAQ